MPGYHLPMTTSLVELRPARHDDTASLAAVHAEAWRLAYRGMLDGLDLERFVARRSRGWWHDAIDKGVEIEVLEVAGEVAGYASYGPCRMRGTGCAGELYELYLKPEYQGLGFGRRLFASVRTCLERRGLKGLAVRVLTDNEPACGFYAALGGVLTGRSWHQTGASGWSFRSIAGMKRTADPGDRFAFACNDEKPGFQRSITLAPCFAARSLQ
ncbi:GNAT family N-acetyltransferase [Pannonibacter sp. Pt2-lr]